MLQSTAATPPSRRLNASLRLYLTMCMFVLVLRFITFSLSLSLFDAKVTSVAFTKQRNAHTNDLSDRSDVFADKREDHWLQSEFERELVDVTPRPEEKRLERALGADDRKR